MDILNKVGTHLGFAHAESRPPIVGNTAQVVWKQAVIARRLKDIREVVRPR